MRGTLLWSVGRGFPALVQGPGASGEQGSRAWNVTRSSWMGHLLPSIPAKPLLLKRTPVPGEARVMTLSWHCPPITSHVVKSIDPTAFALKSSHSQQPLCVGSSPRNSDAAALALSAEVLLSPPGPRALFCPKDEPLRRKIMFLLKMQRGPHKPTLKEQGHM